MMQVKSAQITLKVGNLEQERKKTETYINLPHARCWYKMELRFAIKILENYPHHLLLENHLVKYNPQFFHLDTCETCLQRSSD